MIARSVIVSATALGSAYVAPVSDIHLPRIGRFSDADRDRVGIVGNRRKLPTGMHIEKPRSARRQKPPLARRYIRIDTRENPYSGSGYMDGHGYERRTNTERGRLSVRPSGCLRGEISLHYAELYCWDRRAMQTNRC